jgi:DNA-directed RNA polymerase subunit RPC12/RpoP
MLLQKYTCPSCGYSKTPTTHDRCGGVVLKIATEWVCNTCFKEIGDKTVCASCSHEFNGNITEVIRTYY